MWRVLGFAFLVVCGSVLAMDQENLPVTIRASDRGTAITIQAAAEPLADDYFSQAIARTETRQITVTVRHPHLDVSCQPSGSGVQTITRDNNALSLADLAGMCSAGVPVGDQFVLPEGLLLGNGQVNQIHAMVGEILQPAGFIPLCLQYRLMQSYDDDNDQPDSLKISFFLMPITSPEPLLSPAPFIADDSTDGGVVSKMALPDPDPTVMAFDTAAFFSAVHQRLIACKNDSLVMLIGYRVKACIEHRVMFFDTSSDEPDGRRKPPKISEPRPEIVESYSRLTTAEKTTWDSLKIETTQYIALCGLMERGILGADGVEKMNQLAVQISSGMNESVGMKDKKQLLALSRSADSTDSAGTESPFNKLQQLSYMLLHDCLKLWD